MHDYEKDIWFLIDCDKMHVQVVRPRVALVKTLGYEVNIDDIREIIEALLNELVDPKTPYFGTYEWAKTRIFLEIRLR